MNRITTSLLLAAATCAMVAGCTTTSTGRGYANRNGPGQGACLVNGTGPGHNACQFNGGPQGPRANMGNPIGACPNQCLARANGPGPRNAGAMGQRGRGPGPAFNANGRGRNGQGGCCGGNGTCAIPAGAATQVDPATADALRVTLEDELTARAFYAAILARHGDIRPFANILRAEERHAAAIRTLMQRHQVDGASVTARTLPEIPATIPECAKLVAQIERDNIALYDRFVQDTREPDIKQAFENLRAASLNNHLPAFERIAGT